jgi:hypothetical protein
MYSGSSIPSPGNIGHSATATAGPGATTSFSLHHQALRRTLIDMLALVFSVERRRFLQPTRGDKHAARARQLAMYLAHVAGGLNLSEVGRLFGRDRTTVAHACALIEDARDDAAFDRLADRLEQALAAQLALAPACAGEARHDR